MIDIERIRAALFGRQSDYRRTFSGPVAKTVLEDLARFCRANESTFHDNERVAAKLDGRREVWLRVQNHLNMSPEELWELTTNGPSGRDG